MINLLMLPFHIAWSLISFIFNLTGRLLGVLLGIILMVIGGAFTATILGAIIGIPILIVGFLLIIRSLFK